MARGLYVVDQLPPIDLANRPTQSAFGTTFFDIYGAPQKIIPKSRLDAGLTLDLEAWGHYQCNTGVTLALGFWFNGAALAAPTTTLALSSVITTGTTPTLWPWHMHWMGTLTAIGTGASGGTWDGMGTLDFGTSLTAMTSSPIPITDALRTVTCDVTTDRAVGVGATYGTSAAANQVTVKKFYVKLMS